MVRDTPQSLLDSRCCVLGTDAGRGVCPRGGVCILAGRKLGGASGVPRFGLTAGTIRCGGAVCCLLRVPMRRSLAGYVICGVSGSITRGKSSNVGAACACLTHFSGPGGQFVVSSSTTCLLDSCGRGCRAVLERRSGDLKSGHESCERCVVSRAEGFSYRL